MYLNHQVLPLQPSSQSWKRTDYLLPARSALLMAHHTDRCQVFHWQLQWLQLVQDLLSVETQLLDAPASTGREIQAFYSWFHHQPAFIHQCSQGGLHQCDGYCGLLLKICHIHAYVENWCCQCRLHLAHGILSGKQCFWLHCIRSWPSICQWLLETSMPSHEHWC